MTRQSQAQHHSDMLRYLINVKFLQRTSLGLGLDLSVEYILNVSSIQHQKLKQKPKVLNIGDYAARLDSKWRSSCLCYPNTGITDVHHHSQPKADPHAPASFPLPTFPFQSHLWLLSDPQPSLLQLGLLGLTCNLSYLGI